MSTGGPALASKDNTKEPVTGSKDAAVLKKQVIPGIIYRTIALVFFMAIIELYFPGSVFSVPLVSASIILYVDSVSGLVLAGKMAKPLSYSLKALAITVFLTLLATSQEQFPAARELGFQVLMVGAIWSAHYLSKAYSDYTGVVTRALLIAGAGFLYYSLFSAQNVAILSRLTSIALIGLASAAVFSLLGILKRHSNARVSYIGNLFTRIESPAIVCMVVAAIMTYLIFIRQSLMVLGFFGLTVIEWAALCVAILLLFIKVRSNMPVDGGQMFGNGQKLAGSLHDDRSELKNAAAKVEEFVKDGKKEGLVALMAAALIGNDVPVERVQDVIAIIVGHEDVKEPPAMFKWTVGNVYDANRKKRLKAVNNMMEAAASAVDNVRNPAEKRKDAEISRAAD
jgi:hypothetical protein